MSPELRDDLEIALGQLDRMRANGTDSAVAFMAAMRTYRVLRRERHKPLTRPAPQWAIALVTETAKALGWHRNYLCQSPDPQAVRARDELAFRMNARALSTSMIGLVLGKDHSSIVTALQRFRARLATDELLRARVAKAQTGEAA